MLQPVRARTEKMRKEVIGRILKIDSKVKFRNEVARLIDRECGPCQKMVPDAAYFKADLKYFTTVETLFKSCADCISVKKRAPDRDVVSGFGELDGVGPGEVSF